MVFLLFAVWRMSFNLGNAIGAYAGGLPIDAGLGYRYPALVGVFIVLIGFVAVSLYSKRESVVFADKL